MQPYHYFIFTYKGILCKHFGRNSNCTVTVTSTVTCLVIILSFGLSRSGCLFLSVCPCLMLNLTNPCCTGVSPIISRRRTRRTADLRPRVEVTCGYLWVTQYIYYSKYCLVLGEGDGSTSGIKKWKRKRVKIYEQGYILCLKVKKLNSSCLVKKWGAILIYDWLYLKYFPCHTFIYIFTALLSFIHNGAITMFNRFCLLVCLSVPVFVLNSN